MSNYKSSEERYNALVPFGEKDKQISEELLGPMYFVSRKPSYDGPPVKALNFKAYREYVAEREHMKLYETALFSHNEFDRPEWHELPEEERERIRIVNNEYKEGMNELGAIISRSSSSHGLK